MNIGIYTSQQLSNDDYHNDKTSISRTQIMTFRKSPYQYYARHIKENNHKINKTPALIFGNAFHTYILEPETFDDLYAVKPEVVRLKDVGRERYEAYKAECEALEVCDKTILSADDMRKLEEMRDALMNHSKARELIIGGIYEQSYVWQDAHSGLTVKARPDIIHDTMYVDLKTISDASFKSYQRAMVDGGYHIQGAMIRDARRVLEGIQDTTVINLAIEKEYPYSIGIYILDDEAIEIGHLQYKQTLLDMKIANVNNNYPDYETQIVGLPKWAI